MKDIGNIKNELENYYASKYCKVNSISQCPNGDNCTCKIAAETQAYFRRIIPDPYHKFTINDFDGLSLDNDLLIDARVALEAKKKVVDYCWEGVSLLDIQKLSPAKLNNYSCISKRRLAGNNVVIFDDSSLNQKSGRCPRGKTFIASLIMKEAIQNRFSDTESFCQTYDWVEYPILENKVLKKEDISVSELRSSYWLVVDDIVYTEHRWRKQALDAFFLERFNDGLPTILVIRFDITKFNSEDSLGVAMTKIIRDPKTFIISLVSNE